MWILLKNKRLFQASKVEERPGSMLRIQEVTNTTSSIFMTVKYEDIIYISVNKPAVTDAVEDKNLLQ